MPSTSTTSSSTTTRSSPGCAACANKSPPSSTSCRRPTIASWPLATRSPPRNARLRASTQRSPATVGAGVRSQRPAGSSQRAAPEGAPDPGRPLGDSRAGRAGDPRLERRCVGPRTPARGARRDRGGQPDQTTCPTSGAGAMAHSHRAATTARARSASCCTAAVSSPARSTPQASRSGGTRAAATGSRLRELRPRLGLCRGLRWDTGGPGGGNGPRWWTVMRDDTSSFVARHPAGYWPARLYLAGQQWP